MKKTSLKPNLLTCIIAIFLVICMSMLMMPITAEEDNSSITEGRPILSITGTSIIECEPDLVVIYLKIRTIHPHSATVAKDEAAVIIDSIIEHLLLLGISEDDIETMSYDIEMKYEWENQSRVFKGYEVTADIKVSLTDFDFAGSVIDISVEQGALIDRVCFDLSPEKRQEMKTTVFAQAAVDAKNKAEAIADSLGYGLGEVHSVDVNSYDYSPFTYWKNDLISLTTDENNVGPSTSILPSDLQISGSVNIEFEMVN